MNAGGSREKRKGIAEEIVEEGKKDISDSHEGNRITNYVMMILATGYYSIKLSLHFLQQVKALCGG